MVLPLINALERVVFFIKDTEARYVLVNQSLVQRLGHTQASLILGAINKQYASFPVSFLYLAK